MNQAAEVFGVEFSKRNAGGDVTVENRAMSLDGMQGYYVVYFQFHPTRPEFFTVHRGNQTMEPKDATTQEGDHDQE